MYILNKCPTKRLQGYTPEEAWSEKKPGVSHLRIFGSLCFKHVPEQNRKKLDDKAEPMILIGYHPNGVYKLYDLRKRKVVISRDVLIDETKGSNWEINVVDNGERKVIVNLEDKVKRMYHHVESNSEGHKERDKYHKHSESMNCILIY